MKAKNINFVSAFKLDLLTYIEAENYNVQSLVIFDVALRRVDYVIQSSILQLNLSFNIATVKSFFNTLHDGLTLLVAGEFKELFTKIFEWMKEKARNFCVLQALALLRLANSILGLVLPVISKIISPILFVANVLLNIKQIIRNIMAIIANKGKNQFYDIIPLAVQHQAMHNACCRLCFLN